MKADLTAHRWPLGDYGRRPRHRRIALVGGIGIALLVITALALTITSSRAPGGTVVDRHQLPAGQAVPAAAPGLTGSWVPPQAGWLYVLDTNDLRTTAQILLVDPGSGVVKDRVPTGYAPDIALSPDGSRLYVASTLDGRSILAVIDTASGATLQTVEIPDREIYALQPVWSRMAVSRDGRWVYVNQLRIVTPGAGPAGDEYSVATFDTQHGRFLPERAQIPGCSSAFLAPSSPGGPVAAFCQGAHEVRFLQPAQDGSLAGSPADTPLALPASTGQFAGVLLVNGAPALDAVTKDGQVVIIDGPAGRIVHTAALALPAGRHVVTGAIAVSPDGARLYLGLAPAAEQQLQADQVLVVDTATWQTVQAVSTSQPFTNVAISPDGRTLYELNPMGGSVVVIDIATYHERAIIAGLGEYPGLVLVAP